MSMYDPPYDPRFRPAKRRTAVWPVLLTLALLLIPLGGLAWWFLSHRGSGRDAHAEPRPVAPRSTEMMSDEKVAINVYTKARKAVVHIASMSSQRGIQGTGSGFIWDEDGHVVTNYHVIQEASSAVVILDDNTSWRASVVGVAPDKDLAVLFISAPKSKLNPITVGSSHDLQVGQNAYALGNPFGLDQSFSRGIVSALGREIESVTRRPIKNVIQTDAAVNPGNSGGPLLDSDGRLIGVNTAIYSPSGANVGIGFAIPVDEVNRVVPQLIRTGRITRPGLGVVAAPDQIARRFEVDEGALIWRVVPGTAADKAGLRGTYRDEEGEIHVGDIIVAVNDKPIQAGGDLGFVFEDYKIGESVTITFVRNGQRRQITAMLEAID